MRQIVSISEVFDVERFVKDVDAYRTRHGLAVVAIARAAGINHSRLQSVRRGDGASFDVIVRLAVAVDVSLDNYVREHLVGDIAGRLETEFERQYVTRRRGPRARTTPKRAMPDVDALARDINAKARELGFNEVPSSQRSTWAVDVRNDGYVTEAWRIAKRVAPVAGTTYETILGVLLGTTTPLGVTVTKIATWLGRDPDSYLRKPIADDATP